VVYYNSIADKTNYFQALDYTAEVTTSSFVPENGVINNVWKSSNLTPETKQGFQTFVVFLRSDGTAMVIPQRAFGNLYLDHFTKKVAPVFNKAVRNLMNIRDYLLLQLDLEYGNISEEYFDKEEKKYLSEAENIPDDELSKEVNLLFGLLNLPLDAEDISEILNCPIDNAEKALKNYICEG
jgi:hypothetical protein